MDLKDKIEIIGRHIISDSRGYFLKVLTGTEKGLPDHTGEIYLTVAKPSESRGGHYHESAKEWFIIIRGEAILSLEDVITKERLNIKLDSNKPVTIAVPPKVAHIFYNSSHDDFFLLAYCDCLYDPEDTIPYQIITPYIIP